MPQARPLFDTADAISPAGRGVKVPPHSIEAEQAVLGGIMLHAESFWEICDELAETDYYRADHRLIWAAIVRLAEQGSPVDVLTVGQALEHAGVAGRGVDVAYLSELIEHIPGVANLRAYAGIVRERSTLRQLINAANRIADSAFNPQGAESAELLDKAEQAVFQISQNRVRSDGPVGVDELARNATKIIQARIESQSTVTGLATGFAELDRLTAGLQDGDLVIVAARPSMGKTSLAMNFVEHACMREGRVLVFSMEMSSDSLMLRMLSSHGRIHQSHMRNGQLTDQELRNLPSALELLRGCQLYIDDAAALSPMEIRSRARRVAREQGDLTMIVVDYLQLMQIPGNSEHRAGEISVISRSLKALAKEMNCPVVAVSQLNRALEQRPDKRPIMSDLRDSGAIEQDADLILFIYRDEVYNQESPEKGTAEIIIGKHRNGPIGTMKLAFMGHYTRFGDLAHDRYEDKAWGAGRGQPGAGDSAEV